MNLAAYVSRKSRPGSFRRFSSPRNRLGAFLSRPEASHIGLYFLFGERDGSPKPVAYVGQTEDLPTRLRSHHANRDFWTTGVAIISRTHSFTQAHLRYLEWLSIREAQLVGRYQLENGNDGAKPFVPEPMEADVLDCFETASVLLATLGFPIFEPPAGRLTAERREVFLCRGPNADAKGAPVDDGFVVFKGSITRRQPVASAADFGPWIEELVKSGVLEPVTPEQCRLKQDYVVNSPSYAAALVLARHANGWQEWKLPDGRTLHDVYRASSESERQASQS